MSSPYLRQQINFPYSSVRHIEARSRERALNLPSNRAERCFAVVDTKCTIEIASCESLSNSKLRVNSKFESISI